MSGVTWELLVKVDLDQPRLGGFLLRTATICMDLWSTRQVLDVAVASKYVPRSVLGCGSLGRTDIILL